MKRSILLFAILGLLGDGAYAQSNVTLYGLLDSGILYQSNTAGNAGKGLSALDGGSGPSFWGMEGAEDIGGGYKAIFRLESGISTVNGGFGNSSGTFFGRDAYVGMETPYGTVHLGSEISAFYFAVALNDPKVPDFFASAVNPFVAASFGGAGFVTNEISYTSPTIAGFRWRFDYGFGGVAGDFGAGSQISSALNYNNGPISATLGYYGSKDSMSGASTLRGETASVGYTLGPVTARLLFDKYRNLSTNAALTNVNVYGGGLEWQVTQATTLTTAAYYSQDQNVDANRSLMYRVKAAYGLSKNTTLYGQVGLVHNDAGMNTSLALNAPSTFQAPKGTTVGVNIGIQHAF